MCEGGFALTKGECGDFCKDARSEKKTCGHMILCPCDGTVCLRICGDGTHGYGSTNS